jgi:hypothetical protein
MMMELPDIREPTIQTLLHAWLTATGELFVERYYPHSGGSGTFYVLTTPADLADLIVHADDGALFFFLKQPPFVLRGMVDAGFMRQAAALIDDGQAYVIADLAVYPEPLSFYDDGHSHAQLWENGRALEGMWVRLGYEPDTNPMYWQADRRQDRLTATKKSLQSSTT